MAAGVKSLECRLVLSLIRGWTRVYTWGAPQPVRDDRRAEIESDLWESQHDRDAGDGFVSPWQLAVRLVLGIPADLAWRMEQTDVRRAVSPRTFALAASLFLLVVLWMFSTPAQSVPPRPSSVRLIDPMRVLAPPPPPPSSATRQGRSTR